MTGGPAGDIALVRRMLAGDEEAFGRFFEASYPAVYRFALARLAGDREAAADVAQTTICKAIGKLHTFRGEAALLTWLCTVCRHELYHRERQHQRRAQVDLLEGATVGRFLDWASRELGVPWEYADPTVRPRFEDVVLHGSIEGLTPDEALRAVLPTCGLRARRDKDRIVVTLL